MFRIGLAIARPSQLGDDGPTRGFGGPRLLRRLPRGAGRDTAQTIPHFVRMSPTQTLHDCLIPSHDDPSPTEVGHPCHRGRERASVASPDRPGVDVAGGSFRTCSKHARTCSKHSRTFSNIVAPGDTFTSEARSRSISRLKVRSRAAASAARLQAPPAPRDLDLAPAGVGDDAEGRTRPSDIRSASRAGARGFPLGETPRDPRLAETPPTHLRHTSASPLGLTPRDPRLGRRLKRSARGPKRIIGDDAAHPGPT